MSLSAVDKKKTYETTKIIVCIYLFSSFHTTTDKINLFRNCLLRIFWLVSIDSKTVKLSTSLSKSSEDSTFKFSSSEL